MALEGYIGIDQYASTEINWLSYARRDDGSMLFSWILSAAKGDRFD